MLNRLLPAAMALSLCACVTEPPPEPGESAAALAVGDNCPKWGCDSNSPLMDGLRWDELHRGGLPNEEGISLVELRKAGVTYAVRVAGDRLIGDAAWGPDLVADGLVGAQLVLKHARGETYIVYILAVHRDLTFWIGDPDPIESYRLVYSVGPTPTSITEPLCPEYPEDGVGVDAIIFAGDRYDAATKTVITGRATTNWFNVACQGSTQAKMHFNRHTRAGSDATHQTSAARRTTLLKMYVADYCGTGDALTTLGTKINWTNGGAWTAPLDPTENASFEATWTHEGATCLDQPRLDDPEVWQAIEHRCPELLDAPCLDKNAGYIQTAIPL